MKYPSRASRLGLQQATLFGEDEEPLEDEHGGRKWVPKGRGEDDRIQPGPSSSQLSVSWLLL